MILFKLAIAVVSAAAAAAEATGGLRSPDKDTGHRHHGGPSVVRSSASSPGYVADVVSIGSRSRPALLEGQADTWASPYAVNGVRNFWGFDESIDGDVCSAATKHGIEAKSEGGTCASRIADGGLVFGDPSIESFVASRYGQGEGGADHRNDAGWICAQRRVGIALGWLQEEYGYDGKSDDPTPLPDALLLVDDDSYLDVGRVGKYMAMEEAGDGSESSVPRPLARAACLFDDSDDGPTSGLPFKFAYGGFGVFFNREAIRELATPIRCNNDDSKPSKPCVSLEKNGIGEATSFEEGMSAFELFASYAAREDYCMHSDWLVGYMVEHYLRGGNSDDELAGMKTYPRCGNFTASGDVRPCRDGAAACHRQGAKDMEAMALSSYVRDEGTGGFENVPKLAGTNMESARKAIAEKEKEKAREASDNMVLPNVLLIGAQKAATSSVASWLFANGVCRPDNLDDTREPKYNKEVHYFDHPERYERGVQFYTNRFKHCFADEETKLVMDATPETLKEARRVRATYLEAGGEDLAKKLKMIVILREPVEREISLHHHMRAEYLNTHKKDAWYSHVADGNEEVMPFERYAKEVLATRLSSPGSRPTGAYVDHLKAWAEEFDREQLLVLGYDELKSNPEKVQWRIQQFLGARIAGELPRVNAHGGTTEDEEEAAAKIIKPLFRNKNLELYKFLDDRPGQWMEQFPFPRFNGEDGDEKSKFAYATVLGWNPDESQRQVYVEAVLVWIASLGESGTDYDVVVMMNYDDRETQDMLEESGALVKRINNLERVEGEEEHFEPWFADVALAKIHAFQLANYERVQLMDADVAIEQGKNPDVLFLKWAHARLVSEGLGGDSPLRAGWMMIRPSKEDFENLEATVKNGEFDVRLGWDRLDLPVEYPGWKFREGALNKWGFFGGQLEQGLLYHHFYAQPKKANPSASAPDLLTLLDDEEMNSHGLVHFYGDRKPWGTIKNKDLPEYVLSAQDRWIKAHRNLKMTPLTALLKSPLTRLGQQRYLKERALYGYYNLPFEIEVKGVFSVNFDLCSLGETDLNSFVAGAEDVIESELPPASQASAHVTSICNRSLPRGNDRRHLQSSQSAWDVGYLIVSTILCGSVGCSDDQDIVAATAVVDALSDPVLSAIQSGDFASALSSNPSVISAVSGDNGILGCLVAWGTVYAAPFISGSGGSNGGGVIVPGNNIAGKFYPDWQGSGDTCKNDGDFPFYMRVNPSSWLYATLESCCERYYPGWNKPKCLNSAGTGLWYVDYAKLRCVTDCEDGAGGATCGGLTAPISEQMYSKPRECCDEKLGWVNIDLCENDSLQNNCYIGTGRWYRGKNDELCVRDCDGGDNCGGIVDATWVRLHDSAEACCSAEHSWIKDDLCTARSEGTALAKYWADQGNSKCILDSDTPAKDLSVPIFDTAEACCKTQIHWKSLPACVADATGVPLSPQGTGKIYVDWILQKCAQQCEGPPPCGELDPVGVGANDFYDNLNACCDRIGWIPRSDCELSS